MIAHVTVGAEHVLLRDPQTGSALACIEGSASCTCCGQDLAEGQIVPLRSGGALALKCRGCGERWRIRRGDPLEVEP